MEEMIWDLLKKMAVLLVYLAISLIVVAIAVGHNLIVALAILLVIAVSCAIYLDKNITTKRKLIILLISFMSSIVVNTVSSHYPDTAEILAALSLIFMAIVVIATVNSPNKS